MWRIPHFEKMLYDNGQLMSLYAHAYQVTKNVFKNIIKKQFLLLKENCSPNGGFYSSLNADTENGEGDFYTWKTILKKLTARKFWQNISNESRVIEKWE